VPVAEVDGVGAQMTGLVILFIAAVLYAAYKYKQIAERVGDLERLAGLAPGRHGPGAASSAGFAC
jgi:hypothetical protein